MLTHRQLKHSLCSLLVSSQCIVLCILYCILCIVHCLICIIYHELFWICCYWFKHFCKRQIWGTLKAALHRIERGLRCKCGVGAALRLWHGATLPSNCTSLQDIYIKKEIFWFHLRLRLKKLVNVNNLELCTLDLRILLIHFLTVNTIETLTQHFLLTALLSLWSKTISSHVK